MNVLLVGSGAREHAIAKALSNSKYKPNIFCIGSTNNPGITKLCTDYKIDSSNKPSNILEYSIQNNINWAIIGPEAPLEAGVADKLQANGIVCVGPTKNLAQIETSKGFTRNLMQEYNIPGCPQYKNFNSLVGVNEFLSQLGKNYVVKADGLMGGKGVKVAGEHLQNHQEAIEYCQELVAKKKSFVIEEKFIGQEFSLMSFCDGEHLAHMPAVQDHKRAGENDTGPNTGGMGTYSDANHLLPFLLPKDIEQAININNQTARALKNKFGQGYKGILYGGFIKTENGVKLIEYNARLGDPEAMNVLSILKTDFVELCCGIIQGSLIPRLVQFKNQATVCKYAVPIGYPDNPVKDKKIDISQVQNPDQLYLASVDQREDGLYATGSRTVAVVGIANTINEAEKIAEAEINRITGTLFHRQDIGTAKLIQQKVDMMNNLLK